MTQLREKMLEEIQRRNYSHRTARTYVRIVRDFAEYFHQPPDKLGPEQIRQYQAHLFQAKKLAPATVSQYVSALRFLFVKTLRRHFLAEYIPFPKSRKRLPTVLSPEEVSRLIDPAASTSSPTQPTCFRCPTCSTPMVIVERLSVLTAWRLTTRSALLDSS